MAFGSDLSIFSNIRDQQSVIDRKCIGWSLNELGNYTQAIVYLEKALKIDPTYKWSLSNIGWSLNELGNYTQAIVYLEKLLKSTQIILMVWSSKRRHYLILEIILGRSIIQTKTLR